MSNENEVRSSHVILDKDQAGHVSIDDEVCARIAAIAATDTEGVHSLAGGITRETIMKSDRSSLSKGVKVHVGEGEVTVAVSLVLDFGYTIPDTAARVQERVKTSIENMIAYDVNTVNIKIAGVNVNAE